MLKQHSAILCSALLLTLSQPAVAQAPDEPGETEEMTAADCQVEPDEDGAPDLSEEDIDPFPPEEPEPVVPDGDDDAADDESLTEKLDPCNGVLKPPAVGDQEMTTPPPDEGQTPIIRPGELPEQPPSGG